MINTQSFSISVVGEVTGETWKGNFAAKKRLSLMDRLRGDQFRRDYLGANVQVDANGNFLNVNQIAVTIANALSDLRVRLTEMPKWWIEANYGADLEDWKVVLMVWESANKVEADAMAALTASGNTAAEKLAEPSIKPV